MDKIKSALRKNCSVTTYVLVFIALTSIAVWDVKEIITDYIYENRFTLVKSRNSQEDGYPFLDKPRICLTYDRPLIPGTTWTNFFEMLNDSWHQREIAWPKNMSQSDKIKAEKILHLIKHNTVKFLSYSNNYSLMTLANTLQIGREKVIQLVDTIIRNSSNQILNKNALFNGYGNGFIEGILFSPKISQIIFDGIGFDLRNGTLESQLCLLAPLAEHMAKYNNKKYQYRLDIHIPDGVNRNLEVPMAKKVELRFFDEVYEFQNTQSTNNTSLHVFIKITNSQILDTTRFPPCNRRAKKEEDCLANRRQPIIEQICQCTQFGKSSYIQKPICTFEIYQQCWAKANNEYNRQDQIARDKRLCKPCTVATSFVKTSIIEKPYSFNLKRYPRYILFFDCPQETYLIFEEKRQFQFSQLVSQIGGDLGLYIGFSMISVLQLILFLCRMHWRSQNSAPNASTSKKVKRWIRFYVQFIARSFTFHKENDTSLINLSGPIEHVQRQEHQELKNALDRLNDLIQKLEQEKLKESIEFNVWKQKIEELVGLTKEIREVKLIRQFQFEETDSDQQTKL